MWPPAMSWSNGLAEALDIHGAARNKKVRDVAAELGRALRTRAAHGRTSGSRSTGAPQTGHTDGRRNGTASCGRFSRHDRKDFRDDLPALRMVTVSPMRISFSEMKS